MGRKRISDEVYALRGRSKRKRKPSVAKGPDLVKLAQRLAQAKEAKDECPLKHPDRENILRRYRRAKQAFQVAALKLDAPAKEKKAEPEPKQVLTEGQRPLNSYEIWKSRHYGRKLEWSETGKHYF